MTRTITISPVLNGWVLQVGCQSVAFTDKQTMLTQLSEYYDKPDAVEKRFIERAVNQTMNQPPQPQGLCNQADCAEAAPPRHPYPTAPGGLLGGQTGRL